MSAALAAALAAVSAEADPFDLARARALLLGYDARWSEEPLEVLAVEVEFRAPMVNPATGAASRTFDLGGKIDAIARHLPSGRVMLVEHKTSSEDIGPGSDYWRRLRLDAQISTYFRGARALGHDVEGCIYDVIAKPALRPAAVPLLDEQGTKIVLDANGERVRTKDGKKWRETGDAAAGYVLQTRPETPEEFEARLCEAIAAHPAGFYARGEVMRLEDDERDAAADTWATARALADAGRLQRYPRNPEACMRYGRTCEFFDPCSGVASLDDVTRFRRASSPHEELEAGVDVTDGPVKLPLITTSELRTFRRCNREHHLAYRLGYRPTEQASALRFGTLIHKGLEAWWRAKQAQQSEREAAE